LNGCKLRWLKRWRANWLPAGTSSGLARLCWPRSRAWFDGEDPLKPVSREALNETRQKLSKVREHLAALDKECELPEPPEDVVEVLSGVVRQFEPGF
jgi:hypothetical protein